MQCLICGKNYGSLAHHISLVHKKTKECYIEEFNLPADYQFVDKEYHDKMSNSIKNNYWTDSRKNDAHNRMIEQWEDEYLRNKRTSGIQVKSLEAWKDEKYREKVLKYRCCSYGTQVEYKETIFRSQQEADVAKLLDDNDIKYQYEVLVIPYYDKKGILRTHITDFYIPSSNLILECKNSKSNIRSNELLKQKYALSEGYNYEFITEHIDNDDIINIIRSYQQ
jgi:hypothetical protein